MYKVGIVGVGFIGKKHAQIIKDHKEFELKGVCDLSLSKLSDYNCFKTTNLDELLEQPLDILVVSTPNHLHAEHSIKALKKGCHVICEKPLSLKSHDALMMMETAHLVGKNLFCMLQNRFSPIVQWLKKVIREKQLGKIYWVQVNCLWNRDERYYQNSDWKGKLNKDGGVLFTQFSHFTDILIYLFGHLITIHHTQFWNFNHPYIEFEDSGSLNFQLNSEIHVNFQYSISTFEKNLESSITILGEKGTIKIGGQYMNELIACHIKDYEIPKIEEIPVNQYPGYQGSASTHLQVYNEVIEVLKGKPPQISSIQDAFYSVQLIEKIYQRRVLDFCK
jgi:predicted dehydrogenase